MKIGVNLNINVSKIEKARIIKGAKGNYVNLTTFIDLDEKDQYDNNGFISQDVSKEEREQGEKGPIIGNCRVFYKDDGQAYNQQQARKQPKQAPPEDDLEDTPF